MSDATTRANVTHAFSAAWLASYVLDAAERADRAALDQARDVAGRLQRSATPDDDGALERLELIEGLAADLSMALAERAEPPTAAAQRVLSHLAQDLFRLPRMMPGAVHLAA